MKMTLKGGLFLRGVTKDSRDLGLHNWGGSEERNSTSNDV